MCVCVSQRPLSTVLPTDKTLLTQRRLVCSKVTWPPSHDITSFSGGNFKSSPVSLFSFSSRFYQHYCLHMETQCYNSTVTYTIKQSDVCFKDMRSSSAGKKRQHWARHEAYLERRDSYLQKHRKKSGMRTKKKKKECILWIVLHVIFVS